MLWALPALLAYSPLPLFAVVLIAVPLVWWAERDVGQELRSSGDSSATKSFYAPLIAELDRRWDGVHRIEVVDPRTHWSSAYVAKRLPIARCSERQIDDARNPIFYGRAKLDFAAVAEGGLVRAALAISRRFGAARRGRCMRSAARLRS